MLEASDFLTAFLLYYSTYPVSALILLLVLLRYCLEYCIWSCIILNKYTIAQAISGGVQGFFLTVFGYDLFISLFNFSAGGLVPLADCIWYILDIIFSPVILGVFSYINLKKNSSMFYNRWIGGLLVYAPLNVLIIYIISYLTCYFISFYFN